MLILRFLKLNSNWALETNRERFECFTLVTGKGHTNMYGLTDTILRYTCDIDAPKPATVIYTNVYTPSANGTTTETKRTVWTFPT